MKYYYTFYNETLHDCHDTLEEAQKDLVNLIFSEMEFEYENAYQKETTPEDFYTEDFVIKYSDEDFKDVSICNNGLDQYDIDCYANELKDNFSCPDYPMTQNEFRRWADPNM